jgi:hypothetical protein
MVQLEGLGKLKKIHLIRARTRDLPACSNQEVLMNLYQPKQNLLNSYFWRPFMPNLCAL